MGEAYEFDGQLFTNSGEFLDAVSHEYKNGDREAAVQALEDYGFSVGDINTGSQGPHPVSANDDSDEDNKEEE